MPFAPGQVIARRYLRGQWCTWAQPMRVVSDDEAGLLLWHPAGSDFARLIDADGNTQHEITVDRMRDPKLTVHIWQDCDILVLMPPAAAHSVWCSSSRAGSPVGTSTSKRPVPGGQTA